MRTKILIINEMSLVGNRMLTIDLDYTLLNKFNDEFMSVLNVIMIGDFYQAPPKFGQ
jgi:hypothetical protein